MAALTAGFALLSSSTAAHNQFFSGRFNLNLCAKEFADYETLKGRHHRPRNQNGNLGVGRNPGPVHYSNKADGVRAALVTSISYNTRNGEALGGAILNCGAGWY